jgi:type IV pilus assembly protein PilB
MISFSSSESEYNQLWKRLEREGAVSKDQFKEAVRQSKRDHRALTEILFGSEGAAQDRLLGIFSSFFELPTVVLRDKVISPAVLNLIPKEVAEQHSVIVFKKIRDVIHVATANPENAQTIEFIKRKTGLTPEVFLTTPQDIHEALRRYTGDISTEFARIIEESTRATLAIHETDEKVAQFLPIVTMVNTILDRALLQNASDVHLEPTADELIIRFRIDGLLKKIVSLPKGVHSAVVARLKILSNLKIDEHRLPQDGRFKYEFRDRSVAVRVAAIPTLQGTKIVLRLLDNKEKMFTLQNLGFNQRDFVTLRREISKPHGLILVTGPTGSGKTTTLYTLLRMLNREHVNICTIEDPIEYGLEGVNQTQVNPGAGLTFANGLRSLLRQDPNILMVGEIRDPETADIALNAAMTGHLVLSTLHTNTAFLALQRLIEMGVQPFLAASVTNVIIGQRLVRRICRHCRVTTRLTPKIMEKYRGMFDLETMLVRFRGLQLLPTTFSTDTIVLAHGRGCDRCAETGFQGRLSITEVVVFDDQIAHQVAGDPAAATVRQLARDRGTLTMLEDGILKVILGLTTFDEVVRVTQQ